MELKAVFEKVKGCLEKSCDIESEEISLEKTLVGDLGLDSLDFIDLLYQLEQTFSISILVGELESRVRDEMGDEPFEVDTVITSAGLASLKRHMPEVSEDSFQEGLTVQEIPYLFTVHSICNLVIREVQNQNSQLAQVQEF